MSMKKVWTAVAVLAVTAGFAAGSASAAQGHVFLCYSKYQVDPGVWAQPPFNPAIDTSASQLMGLGYWLPTAEKTIPTNTVLPGGWYLHCNMPVKTTAGAAAPTSIVSVDGSRIDDASSVAFFGDSAEGYYPVAP